MKRFYYFLQIACLTVIIISCSNDNPTNGNQSTLLPTKTGSYWVYESFLLDSNGNRMQANPSLDSTVVAGNITVHDTTGSICITYTIDSSGISSGDSVYYHTEKLKVYTFSNYFTNLMGNSQFNLNIPITEQWVKLVDGEDEDWKVIEQEFPETDIVSGVKMSGTITILGSSSGTENVNAESKSYNTRKFTLKMTFTGTVKFMSYTIPLNLERKTYLYFADNVGLIKYYMEPMKLELLNIPGTNMPGQEKILIRHHLAN